jgi:Leucine-rich repeat (LRR) protein
LSRCRKRKLLLLLALAIPALPHYAQRIITGDNMRLEPIFDTAADSAQYAQVQEEINRLLREGQRGADLDTLMRRRFRMFESVTRFRKVYFSSPNFTSLSQLRNGEIQPDSVRRLTIDDPTAAVLPPEVFRCRNLVELELVNTHLKKLPTMEGLDRLTRIILYANDPGRRLKLGKIPTVKTLKLRSPRPSALPRSYKSLASLELLDLADNSLTAVPRGTTRNKRLRELILRYNQIRLSERKLSVPETLESLDLQRNEIEAVPAMLGKLTHLRKVTFNYNRITSVHPDFQKLQKLESVSFYNNQLTEIPLSLLELPALRDVDLYYNQIEKVPADITRLRSLEILYLAFNRIFSLPDNLGDFPNLKELYLHHNRISELPASLGQLHQLKVLRVNNNYLGSLPDELLQLLNLENLDISANQLTALPEAYFRFPKLKLFSLVDNRFDPALRPDLRKWAEELRAREAVVHLNP